MRLRITHVTRYTYDAPVRYALQRLRLFPVSCNLQSVVSWSVAVNGASKEVEFTDAYGNPTWLVSAHGEPHMIETVAEGEIDTHERSGVLGAHYGYAPLWLYERPTALTAPGALSEAIAQQAASSASPIERLHQVNGLVGGAIAWEPGHTDVATNAEDALARGRGVCQDHAQAFIAIARLIGFPARYVSGYLMRTDTIDQAASHAWAEAHVPDLGWVGFDPANVQSPDERYVRLAVGRDYRDAMPVSGVVHTESAEALAVTVTVEQ